MKFLAQHGPYFQVSSSRMFGKRGVTESSRMKKGHPNTFLS